MATDFDFCPHCKGSFPFNYPDHGYCCWCGKNIYEPIDAVDRGADAEDDLPVPSHIETGTMFQCRGFNMRVNIEPDPYADLVTVGHPGYFTNQWVEGAVDPADFDAEVEPRFGAWFVPCNSKEAHMQSGTTEEEAERYVREDLTRAAAWCNDEWHFVTVRVTASLCGVELASDSLSGIESDSGEDYFRSVAAECASEAAHEAREKLVKLVECAWRLRAE